MSSGLIPQAFWFRLALDCPYVEDLPRAKGRPSPLGPDSRLPSFRPLEAAAGWLEVRAGWNRRGIAFAFRVGEKSRPIETDTYAVAGRDEIEIWVDTRDTRDVHRATRFCHRFLITFRPGRAGPAVEPQVKSLAIPRALGEPPTPPVDQIVPTLEVRPDGYSLEIFLPAEVLHGYDPENNRRLGLHLRVVDPGRGEEFLSVGREFPADQDPSLWSTLTLKGPGGEETAP